MFGTMRPRARTEALDVTPQQVDVWADANKFKRPRVAAALQDRLAHRAACQWLGDWTTQPRLRAREIAQHAAANDALFQVVVYNVPNRDAGGFSAGGERSRPAYLAWLREVAAGLSCGLLSVGGSVEQQAQRAQKRPLHVTFPSLPVSL